MEHLEDRFSREEVHISTYDFGVKLTVPKVLL